MSSLINNLATNNSTSANLIKSNSTSSNSTNASASNGNPIFAPEPFEPPFWLANPHLQTILPKFFAPKAPKYRREIKKDSLDESDIAYDFYDARPINSKTITTSQNKENNNTKNNDKHSLTETETPLIVLFHGMEGSSDSHYARALAHAVHHQGWHFTVPHFRSCGGIPASGKVFYNAGDTAEIKHMLQTLSQHYKNIYAVGVSLGGNALAKYMGEAGDEAICKAGVVVSAPVDMSSAAMNMQKFVAKRIYTPYLLNPIIKKALDNEVTKAELNAIKSIKRLSDFDHIFTAPRHGYRSNNDYYNRSSALPHLIDVTHPLLLISAMDDPFIGFTATKQDVSDCVTLLDTHHGGHIGYLRYQLKKHHAKQKQFDINWIPETVIQYFKSIGIDKV